MYVKKIKSIATITMVAFLLTLIFVSCSNISNNQYSLRFDTDGGEEIKDQRVEIGEVASKLDSEPVKKGYLFGGWYSDREKTDYFFFSKGITKDTTIYARWGQETKGLDYILKSDDTYEVAGYGTATDEEIYIPATYEGKAVTTIGDFAFSNNQKITRISIPYGIIQIGSHAFDQCYNLHTVHIASSVQIIDTAVFNGCSNLLKISVPQSVQKLGKLTFQSCNKLKEIELLANVKKIDEYTFNNCFSLTEITIPSEVEEIGYRSFMNCSGLINVIVSENVKIIGEEAFRQCKKMTSIQFSSSLNKIETKAFVLCESLSRINIPVSVEVIEEAIFSGCRDLIIYVYGTSTAPIGWHSDWNIGNNIVFWDC